MKKILFVSFLLLSKILFAQEYPVLNYTIKEGLVQMQVTCVFKDSRGIVWIGTKGGLSRYNGEKFVNYTFKNGLQANYISAISEDSKGNIWLVSGRKGLCRFDGSKFHYIKNSTSILQEFLCIDNQDNIFVKDDKTLLRLSGDTLLPFKFPNAPAPVSQNCYVNFDYISKQYFITDSTTNNWIYKDKIYTDLKIKGQVLNVNGRIFIQNYQPSQLIDYFIIQKNQAIKFLTVETEQKRVIVSKTIDVDFFFLFDGQTYILEKNTSNFRMLFSSPFYGMKNIASTKSFYWIGSEKGLKAVANNGFRYFTEKQVPYAWSVVEDKKGRIIFGNYQSDLQLFDGKQIKTLTGYKNIVKNKVHPLFNEWYFDAIRDKFGNVWLPNVEGVFKYDAEKFEHYRTSLAISLAEDKKRNKILAACENSYYEISSIKPYTVTKFVGEEELYKGTVMSILVDNKADYWLAGRDIIRINPDTRKKTIYNQANKKLPSRAVICIFQDNHGAIWASGVQTGLLLYNTKKDIFEPIFQDFINGNVATIEQFDENHLLIADQLSLYLLHLTDFHQKHKTNLKSFNFRNGFIGLEPGQLGGYRDSKGYFWMTSGTVLSRINPAEIDYSNTPPTTYITAINGKPLKFPKLQTHETIELEENQVSISLEALGENLPFKPQYSYKVNDGTWSKWSEQNIVSLNNLARGIYHFEVKSRTASFDETQPNISSIQFKINIPIWRNPDFYQYVAVIVLLLASIIAGLSLYSWREKKRMQTKQRELEEQSRKISFLQIQTLQAQMNPHFTFNVLGTIQKLILTQDTQKAHENLLNLAALLRNYLDITIADNTKSKSLFANEITLSQEIELLKMYLDFEQLQYKNRFNYEINIEKDISTEDYRIPPLIIQPFVENAVKHGVLNIEDDRIGNIWIKFEQLDEDEICCTIEDDGIGIKKSEELQQKSLQKFKSRGTQLVKDRIEILNQLEYAISLETLERPLGGTIIKILIAYKFD